MERSIFGENLHFYRQNVSMTQTELAEKVGVGQVTIANYERGTRFPGEDVLVRIARSLGITVSLLFTDRSGPREVMNGEPFHMERLLELLQSEDVSRSASYIRGWKMNQQFSLEEAYSRILIPALEKTGYLWERGIFSVSQEHLISGKVREIISILADEEEVPKSKDSHAKRWIGLCAPSDHHDLILYMLYQLLRTSGWEAAFLGTDVPLRDLESMIHNYKPHIITMSCSLPVHSNGLESYLQLLDTMSLSETIISLGGKGIKGDILERYSSVYHLATSLKEGFEEIANWKKGNVNG